MSGYNHVFLAAINWFLTVARQHDEKYELT